MKAIAITIPEEKKKFEPVSIQITFETAKEMYEFYSVFNFCPIADFVKYCDTHLIRSSIQESFANVNTGEFDYKESFNELENDFNKKYKRK